MQLMKSLNIIARLLRSKHTLSNFMNGKITKEPSALVMLKRLEHSGKQCIENQAARNEIVGKLWVRCVLSEEYMDVKFLYMLTGRDKGRSVNMRRQRIEPVGEALKRLQANLTKKSSSAFKRRKPSENQSMTANKILLRLYDELGIEVDDMVMNCDAWVQGGKLQVDEMEYEIEVNTPVVTSLVLPKVALSGFTIRPHLTYEFGHASEFCFNWILLKADGSSSVLGDNETYTPTPADVGQKIKLVINPKSGERIGEVVSAEMAQPVTPGPSMMLSENRQLYLCKDTPQRRIMSYNVLADVYTNSDFSRNTLFKHCPEKYLDYDYRKLLLTKELIEFDSDIICLQEMDQKHFTGYYQPLLAKHGYQSSMLQKKHKKMKTANQDSRDKTMSTSTTSSSSFERDALSAGSSADEIITASEGSAVFFKSNKFRQIADHSFNISEKLDTDALYTDLFVGVCQSTIVHEMIVYRSGCSLQVVILESLTNPADRVCIATTHLYFHPSGTVVRLIQTAAIVRALEHVKSLYENRTTNVPVVLCGDLNATPDQPPVHYLLHGTMDSNHAVWDQDKEYSIHGMDLNHGLDLGSACGFPKYTNFVPEFKECLDYIFYERTGLVVESVMPFPSEKVLEAEGGLPSMRHPSDHIPLVCQLAWKR